MPFALALVIAAGCTPTASRPNPQHAGRPKPSPPAPKCKPKAVKATFVYTRGLSSSDRAFVRKVSRQAISYFRLRTTNCVKREPVEVLLSAHSDENVVARADYGDIDVFTESPGWKEYPPALRAQTLFHEWYHVLQRTLSTVPPPPAWFFEGSAEWAGFDAAIHFGYFDSMDLNSMDRIRRVIRLDAARPPAPLTKTKPENPGVYSLYFASVDFLLREHGGKQRLRQFWQRYNPGESWRATFRSVFKTKVSTFLKRFEAHREAGFTD